MVVVISRGLPININYYFHLFHGSRTLPAWFWKPEPEPLLETPKPVLHKKNPTQCTRIKNHERWRREQGLKEKCTVVLLRSRAPCWLLMATMWLAKTDNVNGYRAAGKSWKNVRFELAWLWCCKRKRMSDERDREIKVRFFIIYYLLFIFKIEILFQSNLSVYKWSFLLEIWT